MKSTYHVLFFISTFVLFSSVSLAQNAQINTVRSTTPKAQKPNTTSTSAIAVVADVNLTDVKVITSTTSLQVSFSLQSFRGQQNDIVYGVTVYDENFNILAVQNEGSVGELSKGIIVRKNFLYTLPNFINGKVKIFLEATTGSGLALGSKQIWTGELKGKGSFDCKYVESGKVIQCSSTVDQKLTTNYKAESIYSITALTSWKKIC